MTAAPAPVPRRRRRRWLLVPAALLVAAIPWLARQPDGNRDWAVDQARPAVATFDGSQVSLRDIRNFSYGPGTAVTPGYFDAVYELDSVETVWFVLTTFSKRWRAPAHTFVSFGFRDGRYLAVSVEARRERDEGYSIFAGLFKYYELIYVVGSERDLIGRRAAVDGDDTYLYPVLTTPQRARELLVAMLQRSNALLETPEFYNSVFNSCATNLVDHVNAISPGRIPAGFKVMVPGYADDVARSLGLIPDGANAEDVRRRYRVNEQAVAALGAEDFSAAVRTRAVGR